MVVIQIQRSSPIKTKSLAVTPASNTNATLRKLILGRVLIENVMEK